MSGGKVLVVAPHADDEVLGCGGIIQRHISVGDQVDVLIVCDRLNKKKQQRKEAYRCKKILKYNNLFFSGLKDEFLDQNVRKIIKSIEKIYLKNKPNIIYTCNGDDVNIDHQAVHNASMVAFRALQGYSPSKIFLYEIPSSTGQGHKSQFQPNYYCELGKDVLNSKIKAFECYSEEIREEPNPRNSSGLKNFALFRGMQCNSKYAEAFNLIYEKF
tara:strand:- start:4159 stop:4803 length:645 start_codon:yes stop_codon:yes gene_type:complete